MADVLHDPAARRALRERLDLSRPQFARLFGVAEVTIVRWEQPDDSTERRGLEALVLHDLDIVADRDPVLARDLVLRATLDLRGAVRGVLEAAGGGHAQ